MVTVTNYFRSPVVHFLALGAVLFGAAHLTDDGRALGVGREPIEVSAERIDLLRDEWMRETRRAPAPHELRAMIRRYADEEILVREALQQGLDREDPVVFRRLVRNVRFLHGDPSDGPRADDREAFEEALALGLNERDIVVRRRLREALAERIVRDVTVSEAEVREHVAANPDRYSAPERVSFRQLFLDADRRGAALARDVEAVQSALAAGGAPQGDAFLEGSSFQLRSEEDLTRIFGARFAHEAMAAPLERWSKPIESAWGVHFIRLVERREAQPADFETVRRRARYALLAEREEQAVAEALQRLRNFYPLRVDRTFSQLAVRE